MDVGLKEAWNSYKKKMKTYEDMKEKKEDCKEMIKKLNAQISDIDNVYNRVFVDADREFKDFIRNNHFNADIEWNGYFSCTLSTGEVLK